MHKSKLFRKSALVLTIAITSLLSGCTRYNFTENAYNVETEIYTEIYTEVVTYIQPETQISSIPSEPEISFNNEPQDDSFTKQNSSSQNGVSSDVTENKLTMPTDGYTIVTSNYSSVIVNTINNQQTTGSTNLSNENTATAELYAANMASRQSLINSSNSKIHMCVASNNEEQNIRSAVSNLCSTHNQLKATSSISIGVASSSNSQIYICIVIN